MSWLEEVLFPRRCPVCQGIATPPGAMICKSCAGQLVPIGDRGCLKCGRVLRQWEEECCQDCESRQRSILRGLVGYDYSEGNIRELILAVKYHNARQLLDYPCGQLAVLYQKTVASWQADCLIPVPIHVSRRRKRGFNQAEEIAERFSRSWGIPVERKALVRTRKTQPQKELTPAARLTNLMQAFSADKKRLSRYRTVILVDDIFTTGSTIEACARVLLEAGASGVYMICLAAAGQ